MPLAALQERLKNDKRRPLLQVPDRRAVIERLLNERRPQYLASADVVVDAGAPTVVVVRRLCALRGVELPKRTAPPQQSGPEKESGGGSGAAGSAPPRRKKTLDKSGGPG